MSISMLKWTQPFTQNLITTVLAKTYISPALATSLSRTFSTNPHNELHVQLEPLDGEEGIFLLTLTRPTAKNAIGRQLLNELKEAIQALSTETTSRCVILRSTVPGVFCAGADLKERAQMTHRETAQFVSDLRSTLTALERLPQPTIASIDGYALGGGAELALACDIRVCGPQAQFAFPETRLGIIPGAGGTQRLPRAIGRSRAKELIFTGKKLDYIEAFRIGLADHITVSDSSKDKDSKYTATTFESNDSNQQQQQGVEELALRLAREMSGSGPIALRAAKRAISYGADLDLASGLALEEACYAQVIPSKDRLEGLRAFAEKRAPRFTGE
jgi:methylglutaconyl-CoA hydratase